jgi:hypothetical protein
MNHYHLFAFGNAYWLEETTRTGHQIVIALGRRAMHKVAISSGIGHPQVLRPTVLPVFGREITLKTFLEPVGDVYLADENARKAKC